MNNCATCKSLKIIFDEKTNVRVYHCERKIKKNYKRTVITAQEQAEGCLRWNRRSFNETKNK